MKKIIEELKSKINNPEIGLPEEVFLFLTCITPVINVDLLIKNTNSHTLLTWRDDGIESPGWHIPGGIIRYKETIHDRIKAVAMLELGSSVNFKTEPLAINEFINPSRKVRGHFISLLYECTLITPPNQNIGYRVGVPKPGEWAWHNKCPDDIISIHKIYRKFI